MLLLEQTSVNAHTFHTVPINWMLVAASHSSLVAASIFNRTVELVDSSLILELGAKKLRPRQTHDDTHSAYMCSFVSSFVF